MEIVEVIGVLAGIFTTIAVLPQIVKAVRTKKVGDVSSLMFLMLATGVGFWTVYGILKEDAPIILTNGISFVLNCIMLYISLREKRQM